MQNFLNSPPGITQKNKKIANHLILVISDFIIHLYRGPTWTARSDSGHFWIIFNFAWIAF